MKRDIIIGDIHGCLDELKTLMRELDVTDADRLISVGDLVDRGPDSHGVWQLFANRPNSIALMGNHERKHVRGVLSYSQEIVRVAFGDQYPDFCAWASTLPYFLETPDVLVVHGGFEPGVPLAEQREDVLAATTSGTKHLAQLHPDRHWTELYDGEKPIVFGHEVVGDAPRVVAGRSYALDTGACHGGRLTALVLPGFEIHQVEAARDYWKEEQQRWQVPVLRNRPWKELPFKKLAAELAKLRGSRRDEVQAFVSELERWVTEIDALVPRLLERVEEHYATIAERMDDRVFRKTLGPRAQLLFMRHAGTLSADTLRTALPTPAAMLDAAAAYGIEPPRR